MITVHIMGGLGNQLFQIFHTIAYALRYNLEYVFPYSETLKTGLERPTYWNNLLSNLKSYTSTSIPRIPMLKEPYFHYTEIPKINQDFMFFGYFQSHKYFEDQYNRIRDIIGIPAIQEQERDEHRIPDIDYNTTISLHFRLGDYKEKQDCHPLTTPKYYIDSLNHILSTDPTMNNATVLYFYEKEDEAIVESYMETIKSGLESESRESHLRFVTIPHEISDWQQMIQMSLCRHNVIANSSFSWWGAYFNSHEDKIVCYPSVWFGPKLAMNNTKDLCPSSWKKISIE